MNENMETLMHGKFEKRGVPIDFNILDKDNQNVIYMTEGPMGTDVKLEIINISGKVLEIRAKDQNRGNENFYNFKLSFRPGTLVNSAWEESFEKRLQTKGLRLGNAKKEKFTTKLEKTSTGINSLLVIFEENFDFQPGEKIEVNLKNMIASPQGGSRGTRVELAFDGLYLKTDTKDTVIRGTKLSYVNIINQREQKEIPLEINYNGSNQILNDGKTQNDLNIVLKVQAKHKLSLFGGDRSSLNPKETASKFIVMFDCFNENGEKQPKVWMLMKKDAVNRVSLEACGRDKENKEEKWFAEKSEQGKSVQWIITVPKDIEDMEREILEIKFDNIITDMPTGIANISIRYENIPGYWDGILTCPVEKTPIIVEADNVGIGVQKPTEKLSVKGNINTEGDIKVKGNLNVSNLVSFDGKLEVLKGIKSEGDISSGGNMRVDNSIAAKGNINSEGKIQEKGNDLLPRGVILMWNGSVSSIPAGWLLCNGQNGTPDLRDRFIVGAGYSYNYGDTGGQKEVVLSVEQMPSHSHSIKQSGSHKHRIDVDRDDTNYGPRMDCIHINRNVHEDGGGSDYGVMWTSGDHSHPIENNGGEKAHENRPPYYALCYIMKN